MVVVLLLSTTKSGNDATYHLIVYLCITHTLFHHGNDMDLIQAFVACRWELVLVCIHTYVHELICITRIHNCMYI